MMICNTSRSLQLILAVALAALAVPLSAQAQRMADRSFVDTGSFGEFTPTALIQAPTPWRVFRAVGSTDKSGFPCDRTGGSCSVRKNYIIEEVLPQVTQRVAEIGRGQPMFSVTRSSTGSLRNVQLTLLSNAAFGRIDQIRATSLLGGDGSMSSSVLRIDPRTQTSENLGFVEGKGAAWARFNPHSFFYLNDQNQPQFAFTVVENMMWGGLVQNFFGGTPGRRRMLGGTYWCASHEWRPASGLIERLLKNDEFDMDTCRNERIMSSVTEKSIRELAANWFFNRVDSRVHLHWARDYSYEVQSNREFVCPFDCDGTVYRVNLPSRSEAIKITSDVRTWTSSTRFKIKIVTVDWDRNGIALSDRNIDLRDLARTPRLSEDVVAVLVSEVKDVQNLNPTTGNGNYTQHTYIAFPPQPRGGVPQWFVDSIGTELNTPAKRQAAADAYQARILDAVFAMMPDQVQTSPELADAEEKLDELRAYLTRLLRDGDANAISADALFDVLSETDATTSATLVRPGSDRVRQGKVQWLLRLLGESI